MASLYNLARMTTATTGTGTITLGSAAGGALTFAQAGVQNGETVTYAIRDGANSEIGRGVYTTAGTTLTRSVLKSTNSDAAINLSGTAQVIITSAAEDFADRVPYGTQSIWIPAGAMKTRTTNGAASGSVETTTNKVMIDTLDFDTTTQEFAQFSIRMPASWNEGTVTFSPIWSHASTTTNFGVVWQLAGVAFSNDDAMDTAFGTAQTSTDTGGTTNDEYEGPTSSAITIAGTPAAGDLVVFQVARVPANGSDTMAIDARLHGVVLNITTDVGHD